mmetsp:Transcript_17827/g.51036  ORF Transcript_17827/g.51036 Transcript_17827/m.51036 type:complete len:232 (-) Transcript_17827:116-811(-)
MTLVTYSSSSGVHFPLLSESFGDEDNARFAFALPVELFANIAPVLTGFFVASIVGGVLLLSGPSTAGLEASSSTLLGLTGFDTPVGRADTSCGGFRLATNLGDSSSEDALPVLATACFVSRCFTTSETSRSLVSASGGTMVEFCVIKDPLVVLCDSSAAGFNSVAFPTTVVAGSGAGAVIGSLAWFVSASLIVISKESRPAPLPVPVLSRSTHLLQGPYLPRDHAYFFLGL